MNKNILLGIGVLLIIIAGGGGYFLGAKQGRLVLQKELDEKQVQYQQSKDAVRIVAEKYLSAFKFEDYKEAYSYSCPEFKNSVSLEVWDSYWKNYTKKLSDQGTIYQGASVDDVVISNQSAKVRFTDVFHNPLTQDFKRPSQSDFQFIGDTWCSMSDASQYLPATKK